MKKILIVEDDQLIANLYGNKFSREGFQVKIAPDGQAGLDLVHSFQPDAVILDLMLPKMTGVELTKRIRAEPSLEQLPVIVFSNAYLTSIMQQAWKAGATKCLSKANSTPRQVIEVVRHALSLNGAPAAPLPADGATVTPPSAPVAAPAPVVRPRAELAAAPAPVASSDPDAEFQAGLRQSFIEGLPATLAILRAGLQELIKADQEATRLKQLNDLYRRIHALTGNAGIADVQGIARMGDALEALLKALYEKPRNINASSLRTVASAIDFLAVLFETGTAPERPGGPPPTVLVVDDEAISRRAVVYALERANLKSVNVEDPAAAYDLLAETQFDLVILDVDMPGMSGFELCTKMRRLPAHKKTPVVFVTGLNDFESRTSSTMNGGNDFIAKPFLFMELAVKALVYVMRNRRPTAR